MADHWYVQYNDLKATDPKPGDLSYQYHWQHITKWRHIKMAHQVCVPGKWVYTSQVILYLPRVIQAS